MHNRLGGAIPYRKLYNCIGVIVEELSNDLIEDQVVTVRRFGTLSPHTVKGHKANDVTSGQVRELPDRKSVKLHPHESFSNLLLDRQDRFRDNET